METTIKHKKITCIRPLIIDPIYFEENNCSTVSIYLVKDSFEVYDDERTNRYFETISTGSIIKYNWILHDMVISHSFSDDFGKIYDKMNDKSSTFCTTFDILILDIE